MSSLITTIITSIGSALGSVLNNMFSAVSGFFKFLLEERKAQKEAKKEKEIAEAKKTLEAAVDNGSISDLIDASKDFGKAKKKK